MNVAGTGGYTREKVLLVQEDLKRARAMIRDGQVPGRGVEWCDERTKGLVLRITPKAATWYLRLRDATVNLGRADTIPLALARDHAAFARVGKRNRKDDLAEGRGTWTWNDLVREFLAHKEKKLRPSYYRLYESYLRLPAFERIARKHVAKLTIGDLEEVRNSVLKSNAVSTAWRAVQQGKEALSWAWQFNAGVSGLGKFEHRWWERWSLEYESGTRDHVPTLADLARTLVVAEMHRTLGGTEHATAPGTLGALWAVVLTAQRTGQLVLTRRARIFDDEDPGRSGWASVNWTGDEMKGGKRGGRPHALPIPPEALAVIERYRRKARAPGEPASPYLFPSIRGEEHVTQTALNQLLYRLQGKSNRPSERTGAKPGTRKRRPASGTVRENLFERYGIEPWTPHDARRALAGFLDERYLGGAASAILAHRTSKKDEDERQKVEAVTRLHYAKNQRIPLKAEGMALWCSAILAAYATERERLFPRAAVDAA